MLNPNDTTAAASNKSTLLQEKQQAAYEKVYKKWTKDADKKYKGTYTFAKEDLMDEEGNPIKSGTVVVLLNGSSQGIDPEYSDVSKWPGDYTMTLTSDTKGKATIELLIDGKVVKTDKVKLK